MPLGKLFCSFSFSFSYPGGSWDWEYLGFASPEVKQFNVLHQHRTVHSAAIALFSIKKDAGAVGVPLLFWVVNTRLQPWLTRCCYAFRWGVVTLCWEPIKGTGSRR